MIQVKVTHPTFLKSSPDLEAYVKQFLSQKLNKPRREIYHGIHVAKLSQSSTVRVKLSDHRFKIFFLRAKKQLQLSNDETYNVLFNNENFTSLNH